MRRDEAGKKRLTKPNVRLLDSGGLSIIFCRLAATGEMEIQGCTKEHRFVKHSITTKQSNHLGLRHLSKFQVGISGKD